MRILLLSFLLLPLMAIGQNDFPDFSKAINGDQIIELFKTGSPPPFVEGNHSVHLKTLKTTFNNQIYNFQIFFKHKGVLYALAEGSNQYPIDHFTPSYKGLYFIKAENGGCTTYIKFDEHQELDAYHEHCYN